MKRIVVHRIAAALLIFGLHISAQAQDAAPGRTVESLLDYARENNPEFASMRYEAEAASERVGSADALDDPKFRVELMDITRMGEQNATLSPSRVRSTKYTVMQDLPWIGKRDLKRSIAEMNAEAAQGEARGTWAEIAARLKAAHAQLYTLCENGKLSRQVLDLMIRLEKIAQVP